MNLALLAKRLLGRPTWVPGPSTVLGWHGAVLNASDSSDNISVGAHCRIDGELFVFAHGGQIRFGDWCFLGKNSRVWSAERVHIGSRVLISHGVSIMDSLTHPLDPIERHQQFKAILTSGHPTRIDLQEAPVEIEDDVWIGAGAIILRGVRIGARSVVGAGAVVTKNVPPDVVVGGNPANVLRSLR
jgi:acetyltransferase-like isoleucine patch superfamily enzyme